MHILSKKQAIYIYNFILFCNFKKLKIFNEFSGEGVLREINYFYFFFFSVLFICAKYYHCVIELFKECVMYVKNYSCLNHFLYHFLDFIRLCRSFNSLTSEIYIK